jgi:hypothetical protein
MGVADIIKKNLGNLTGGGALGIAAGIAGSFMSGATNSIQTNAAAAKILGKSPLELNDTSPTAHMKQNPYEYGTVYYPLDVANLGTGHYILFDIIINDKTVYQNATYQNNKINPNFVNGKLGRLTAEEPGAGNFGWGAVAGQSGFQKQRVKNIKSNGITENRITNLSSGLQNQSFGIGQYTHNHVSDTIVLYTPPGLKTTYNVTHEGAETGSVLGQAAALLGLDFGAGVGGLKALAIEAAAIATSLTPGGGDLKALLQKTGPFKGTALNNNLEMAFRGVPMREFNYSFEFTPRNKKELESAQKIINLFKFHMHPELNWMNQFVTPSEFQITYMYLENRNSYIPKISRCVLKSMELQHGDESVFSTFVGDEFGASPIYTKMTLGFAETEIMTKQTIAEGF